jgi:outer membrane protein assembly factor BamB
MKMKLRTALSVFTAFLFMLSIVGFAGGAPAPEKQPKKKISLAEIRDNPGVDSDHDGVANGLELDGYYFDVRSGTFKQWQEGVEAPGPFYTDPTQFSTDQDPYGDGMEVSGVGMDADVTSPADHPLVPAYPDIYLKMDTYTVTPIETITSTTGGKAQSSWTNTTSDEKDTEYHWDVSTTAKVGAGLLGGISGSASVTASGGGKYGTKHTVTHSESGMTEQDWSTAVTTDPSKAAKLRLTVHLHNSGTAPAFDITPTITLMQGKDGIKTYAMEQPVLVLGSGDVSGPFVSDDITVTLDVLQNIQMKIPVKLIIPQMSAQVKMADGHGGFTKKQKWSDYKPEIEAVSAHLSINKSDGSPVQEHLVYATHPIAEDSGYGPTIKLKDMLGFILAGDFTYDPDTGEFSIYGIDHNQWAVGISKEALDNVINQLNHEANHKLMEVVVYRDAAHQWDIAFTKLTADGPTIEWAYYDPKKNKVTAHVTSYLSLKSVSFVDSAGTPHPMTAVEGIGVYTYTPTSPLTGSEQIEAVDVNKKSAAKPVKRVEGETVWPMFGHDPQHTGRSKYTGAQQGVMKWQFKTGAPVGSPAIGADGTVYVGSADNYLYAIQSNGQLKWKFQIGDWVLSSPAIGADGTVYVGSGDHYLYAIQSNGQLKWKYQTGDQVTSSPAIGADGTVYVGSSDHYLYAIQSDGQLKWKYQTGSMVDSSPAIGADGTVYVGSDDNYLHAITPNGQLKWKFQIGNWVTLPPAIGADGTAYVGGGEHYLYAIQSNGQLKWKFQTGDLVVSSTAIGADGTVYVGSYDFYLYAITPGGQLKWKFQTGNWVYSSPAIGADGTVYVGSVDFYLYAITTDGELLWKYKTGDQVYSSPAIGADGTVYVGSSDHYLYAFGETK